MSFFISDALAQPASAATPESSLLSFLPLIGIFVLFYFLLIRPQMKRAKEHKSLLNALAKGDEVVTGGGVLGRITEVGSDFISLEIANGIVVKVQKQSVATIMPKGTITSA
ncbi:MAG: preprotein translocase subunit YajC [Gammaproteobacteria bacterium]|nr:preprotein translocase subunit YajC [Gammaproteobacteria bacterium]